MDGSLDSLPASKRPTLRSRLTTRSIEDFQSTADPNAPVRLQDVACGLRVWKKADGFCARANTVEAFNEMHRVVRLLRCGHPAP
jgi:hypothetical protein